MPPIFTSLGSGSARSYGLIRALPFRGAAPIITNAVQYLLVAGGGGAAGGTGGGGGGGGLMIGVVNVFSQNVYNVAVGAGGSAGLGDGANGGKGGVSYFGISRANNTYTVIGGGAGIHDSRTSPVNAAGGSGGGGGYNSPAVGTSAGGAVQPGSTPLGTNIGNAGGSSSSPPPLFAGAGGGGANGAGVTIGSTPQGGAGGAAFFTSITGSNTAFSGGGGGGTNALVARGGSNGACGGNSTNDQTGTDGFTNRGGGAGAAGTNSGTSGGAGGSGLVVIRYAISSNLGNATVTGSPIYSEVSSDRVFTFTGSGTMKFGDFSPQTANMTSATIYSTWSGGTRSANYSVQYSDDNSTWTTAFSGVMTSTTCGLFTGNYSITPISNVGDHRYWRYLVGATVSGHHPRVSRIYISDNRGRNWNLVNFTGDNCSDSGTIPGNGDAWSVDTLET